MARIFIADDDELVINLLAFKLSRLGHQVSSATDGESALQAIQAEPPDLLILDYLIPILSAGELLEILHASPATSNIPTIILTAAWREQDVLDALDAGISDVMTKPFSPSELLLRIQRILGGRQSRKPNN